jgi:cell division protein FtsQ
MLRKTGHILIWILLAGYLAVGLTFTGDQMHRLRIKNIKVEIVDSLKNRFVSRDDVINQLKKNSLDITGRPIDSLHRDRIRDAVLAIDEIRDATVFSTPDGMLHIRIRQRDPRVRIMGPTRSFYLDENGQVLKLSDRYSARVLVITGTDDEVFAQQQLFALAEYIRSDPFLTALIEEVHVFKDQTIEIIPRVGNERIFFGRPGGYAWKLTKLRAFYKQGLPAVGWNRYESIDLRFSNQVVARKKPEI